MKEHLKNGNLTKFEVVMKIVKIKAVIEWGKGGGDGESRAYFPETETFVWDFLEF